jgi:hypothetical protein
MTLGAVVREMVRNPRRALIERWNWKAAIFSAMFRAALFLWTSLAAGWKAATGAMLVESLYRSATSGFYGAITQAFSKAEPVWAATAAAVLLPGASHSVELAVHLLRSTPNIITRMIASVCFTVVSAIQLVRHAARSTRRRRWRQFPGHRSSTHARTDRRISRFRSTCHNIQLAFRSGIGP